MEPWIQLLGRLHPLVLHLPIGALVLLATAELWSRFKRGTGLEKGLRTFLCGVTAIGALASALSGWQLSQEFESAGDTFCWHRALGFALTVLVVSAALAVRFDRQKLYGVCLGLGLIVLVPVGHFGAEMTHGTNFLLKPFEAGAKRIPPLADSTVANSEVAQAASTASFATVVAPIFNSYCTKCHGPEKQKGGLALHSPEPFLVPTESGLSLLSLGDPAQSELMRRLLLPLEDDDHMPPPSKPQPSSKDLEALEAWVAAGAPFEQTFDYQLEASQSQERPVSKAASKPSEPKLPIEPSSVAIAALASQNIHVELIDPAEQLLWIDFSMWPSTDNAFVERYTEPLLDFIVELNLSGTRITDEALNIVRQMRRLERLDLTNTACSSTGVARLAGHSALRTVNLIGTQVDARILVTLKSLPSLERIYIWNSLVTDSDLQVICETLPELRVVDGIISPAPIQPMVTEAESTVATSLEPSNTLCPITSKPINDAYQIIHDGRVLGFCSPECALTYWK
ncbi:MAG: hypothetical protein ACI8TQ_000424 [Planctomycetota bacterium]|jgi:hypothetical protein